MGKSTAIIENIAERKEIPMHTVIELLHLGAERWGDDPFLGEKADSGYVTASFIETDRESLAFAAALVLRGIPRGSNIAILSEGRTAWVVGEFGILKAGCVSVPLSTKLSPDEVLFRLDHSDTRAVLVSENSLKSILPVLDRARRRPLLILISPWTESLASLAEGAGLAKGTDYLLYRDMVNEGQKGLDTPPAAAGNAFGGKPLAYVMREIEKSIKVDDPVTISYTSGTTGNPKGIMLSHRNYWGNAHSAAEIVEVQRGWKSLIMLPLDHSFAHTVGTYIFLAKGLTMYFVDARGGPMAALRNLPKNLLEVNPDFLLTVPALSGNFMKKMTEGIAKKGKFVEGIFRRGVEAGIARAGNGFNRPSFGTRLAAWFPWKLAEILIFPKLRGIFGTDIKFCVGGGALLEIRQQEFFNAIGVPIYQGYGLTENAPIICSNSPKRHKFGTSGTVIPDLQVRIMKDDTTPAPPFQPGQIVTKGDSVMLGYYRNPEATAETLRDGWLWSGDLGYFDKDGFLVVTGREKALLIAPDGEKYSPETIEEAIINTARYVNQVMAYNEQCRFTTALVTVHAELIAQDIKEGRLRVSASPNEAANDILDAIMADLTAFAKRPEYDGIPAQWRPASFALISAPFDENHGLVNSTLKLVRHKVRDHYRDRIDELYADGSADHRSQGNRAALDALSLP